jgi:epoxyqueuosine reductase
MLTVSDRTKRVRAFAHELGFENIGFAKATHLSEEAVLLEKWLASGMHGTMSWMENHFDLRVDPRKLVPNAKTVISVSLQYVDKSIHHNEGDLRISSYALGDDYHEVIRNKLRSLFRHIQDLDGDVDGRVFTDSAPVMDKAWAVRSGLGWLGKNGNILNKKLGSWFFLGEIILDVEFDYDKPTTTHCGSCTRCIDACPTQAIVAPMVLDSRKCISYLTIELKEHIPQDLQKQMGEWMYGCDICQDVCPWNSKAPSYREERFKPRKEVIEMSREAWKNLDIDTYNKLFKNSAVKRTKYPGLVRNITIAVENTRKTND